MKEKLKKFSIIFMFLAAFACLAFGIVSYSFGGQVLPHSQIPADTEISRDRDSNKVQEEDEKPSLADCNLEENGDGAQSASVTSAQVSSNSVEANEETDGYTIVSGTVTIYSAEGLYNYIQSWSSDNAADAIVIELSSGTSLDMSAYTLTNTIGNADAAFTGSFDGSGYTISGLSVDLTSSQSQAVALGTATNSASTQYVGLFGYASGATICGVAFSGTTTLTFGTCTAAYVGTLVAWAEGCTIYNVQTTANLVYNSSFDTRVIAGVLVGVAGNATNIYQTIVRSSSVSISDSFSRTDDKTYIFGGVVGQLSGGSCISFVTVEASFNFSTQSTFVGTVYLGGVVGKVFDGATRMYNVGVENSYSIDDQASSITCAQVVAQISNSAPENGNLSNIYYEYVDGISWLGEGSYSATSNHIDVASYTLSNIVSYEEDGETKYLYFNNQSWYWQNDVWNFDSVWYISSTNKISLQCFYGSYTVRFSSTSTSVIGIYSSITSESGDNASVTLNLSATSSQSAKYGDEVSLRFVFAEGMQDYYNVVSLSLGGEKVLTINTNGSGASATYTLSSYDNYEIQAVQYTGTAYDASNNPTSKTFYGFVITILDVNLSTAGTYTISTEAKTFSMYVTSVAVTYEIGDGEIYDYTKIFSSLVSGSAPGYVYFDSNDATTTTTYIYREDVTYGNSYRFTSKDIAGRAYSFSGRWAVYNVSSGSSLQIDDPSSVDVSSLSSALDLSSVQGVSNSTIAISFGTSDMFDFGSDFVILAIYEPSACEITFTSLDEGIDRIVVNQDETVSTSGQKITIAKSEQSVKIEVYVKTGYTLNESDFVKTSTFVGACTLQSTTQEEEYTLYTYVLDMTSLTDESYASGLSLNATTSVVEEGGNSLMWWIIGGVCGAVVLAALVVLIVVLVKKRSGGGFGGGFKSKKGGFYY